MVRRHFRRASTMNTDQFLESSQQLLSQSSPSDIGYFGGVSMSYDDMYEGLYMAGEPVRFSEYALSVMPSDGMGQEEYYGDFLPELASEVSGADEEQVIDMGEGFFDPMVVYVVNYKGEGEGLYLYETTKKHIKGKFISKYVYE